MDERPRRRTSNQAAECHYSPSDQRLLVSSQSAYIRLQFYNSSYARVADAMRSWVTRMLRGTCGLH